MDNYKFPLDKLKTKLDDSSKTPIVLILFGSLNPITYLHLRLFELAKDHLKYTETNWEVVGCYISPVSPGYNKPNLLPPKDRVAMCELAADCTDYIMVDIWETLHKEYVRTLPALEHFSNELNKNGGIITEEGTRKSIIPVILAGGDLIESMTIPGVWGENDIIDILKDYGAIVIERSGTNLIEVVKNDKILSRFQDRIIVVEQTIPNDVSSTRVRNCIKKGLSVKYIVPDNVITYINENNLYKN
ncbi:nicotinamide mononucleotide adenylyl transferase [Anaeromyces robustus]|uniref:Nicotinamide-nucleotide adenylyltransferase n=1 Tax=Anaeromyces robustus TaxID=1754192 RepID=A0A1Y1X8E1_9FUNG|nr:nicotinamide mononucleotide adenylyl transferase [Anaeromyces robustus]|eukprot:ORX81978.1 nicotinamide mononucleotide adenylyl transferase [Anaeromyces robustus]